MKRVMKGLALLLLSSLFFAVGSIVAAVATNFTMM